MLDGVSTSFHFCYQRSVKFRLLKNKAGVTHIHSMLEFAHIAREKNCLLYYVKSSVLKSTFVDMLSLWIKSEHTSLFLKCFLLCKTCVSFCGVSLCVPCRVADKSMHRVASESTVKPGKLEGHSELQLQSNTEAVGNKFELFLFIYTTLQGPVQQRNVQGLYSFSS